MVSPSLFAFSQVPTSFWRISSSVSFSSLGVVSLGVVSLGVVSLGVVSLGVVSLGVVSLGVVAFGVVARVVGTRRKRDEHKYAQRGGKIAFD